jgi:hypothetical protein
VSDLISEASYEAQLEEDARLEGLIERTVKNVQCNYDNEVRGFIDWMNANESRRILFEHFVSQSVCRPLCKCAETLAGFLEVYALDVVSKAGKQ